MEPGIGPTGEPIQIWPSGLGDQVATDRWMSRNDEVWSFCENPIGTFRVYKLTPWLDIFQLTFIFWRCFCFSSFIFIVVLQYFFQLFWCQITTALYGYVIFSLISGNISPFRHEITMKIHETTIVPIKLH